LIPSVIRITEESMHRIALAAIAAAFMFALAACGGGDPEDDQRGIGTPDCHAASSPCR
jgi:hypothetical protein